MSVRLRNFVSHVDTDLPLGEGVTVFVGRNGAGKSSVIDAITYAMYGRHTRGANENLVKRGATGASVAVEFTAGGREYLVERRLGGRGQLEGSVLWERASGGTRQVAAGERKQFGESVSEEVAKVVGLDYEKMKVAAIVQQGELDSIVVDFSPRDFKELVNNLIGIDRLEAAYQGMSEVIGSFRSYVRGMCGYDDTNLQELNSALENSKSALDSARRLLEDSERLLNASREEESSLLSYIRAMEPLKNKADLLQQKVDHLLLHVRGRKAELEAKRAEMSDVAAKSEEYLRTAARERSVSAELRSVRRQIRILERDILKLSETRAGLQSKRGVPEELSRVIRRARECLETVRREGGVRENLARLEKDVSALHARQAWLSRELGKLQSQQETARMLVVKNNRCPVCGSRVEKINPMFDPGSIRKHIEEHSAELRDVQSKIKALVREREALNRRISLLDRARNYLTENKISGERDIEALERRMEKMAGEISKISELDDKLADTKRRKSELEKMETQLNETLGEISRAKAYLREHSTSTRHALDRLRKEITALKEALDRIPEIVEHRSGGRTMLAVSVEDSATGALAQTRDVNALASLAIDSESERLLSEITSLAEEASRFDWREYAEKEEKLERLRSETIPDQVAAVQVHRKDVEDAERDVRRLSEALAEVQKAAELTAILTRIRERVYHRDGPVPSSLRSWALKHIASKASEYARLFEIGISGIELSEKARDITIECYGPRGTIDTASMSGGEKVAVALALRFGMAYVMGGYRLDFVVLDEPTVHLDEERKASMVDIISRLGTEDSPLKQVIIITHDAEIFENAEVDRVYRFEATPDGTRVSLGP